VALAPALRSGTSWLSALLASFAAAAALAAAASDAPSEYLDEDTAATVTVVSRPLVFALSRKDLAANARDYATVAAASVNRAGKVDYVLIVYFWSTADPRMRPDPLPSGQPLVLQADDRRIALKLRGHSAHDAGIGPGISAHMQAPPGVTTPPDVYGTDLATVRFLGEARSLALLIESEGITLNYELWEDTRPALRAFVRHMSGGA
jgi:hypothetical protein